MIGAWDLDRIYIFIVIVKRMKSASLLKPTGCFNLKSQPRRIPAWRVNREYLIIPILADLMPACSDCFDAILLQFPR